MCLGRINVFAAGDSSDVRSGRGARALSTVVTDPTGAVVSKATVTADDPTRGTHIAAVTDDSGQYRLTNLAPGNYRLDRAGIRFSVAS